MDGRRILSKWAARPVSRWAWLPAAGLAVALVIALVFDPQWVFNPPWLSLPLNIVFLTLLPLVVSMLAIPAYLSTGVPQVVAVGAGMLAVGTGGGVLSAYLLEAHGVNAAVTLHNTGLLLGGLCQAIALVAGMVRTPARIRGYRAWRIAAAYVVVAGAIAALLAAILTGATPTFFMQGQGPTRVRAIVLDVAMLLFAVTAFAWWQAYLSTRVVFLYWYSLGLVALTIGLAGFGWQRAVGDLIGWTGRAALYLAGVYLLVAVVQAARSSAAGAGRGLGISLQHAVLAYRSLVESTTEAVIAVDRAGTVLYGNEAAQHLFGYPSDAMFGADVIDLIVPPGGRTATRQRVAAGGADGGRLELMLANRRGREFPAELTVFPGSDRERNVGIWVVRDITERKRAEEGLAELNRELEERVRQRTAELSAANTDLEAFAYSVSHDLRAPLRAIDGFARRVLNVEGDHLSDEGRERLARVVAGSAKMTAIIDALLALSRVSRQAITHSTVNLSEIADQIIGELRAGAPDRRVNILIEPDLFARGDRDLLNVLLTNLLGNAFKFVAHRPAPRVELTRIRNSEDGGQPVFCVRDNGAGFDMANADKLFRPFERLHRQDEFTGSGIGLAIVARIIHRHGGRIWAQSAVGQGAAFFFCLPGSDPGSLPRGGSDTTPGEPAMVGCQGERDRQPARGGDQVRAKNSRAWQAW